MRGEEIDVIRPSEPEVDAMGNEVRKEDVETVGNVLVSFSQPSDLQDAERPDGAFALATLYFPRSYTGDVSRCRVRVRGRVFRVVGLPERMDGGLMPTRWNMAVKAVAVDG